MVNNLYVRRANLKVILELTGSRCSSDRRAVVVRMFYSTCMRATERMKLCTCHCNTYDTVEQM